MIGLAFAEGQLGGIHAGDGDVAIRRVSFDEAILGWLFLVVDGFFLVQIGLDLLEGGVSFGHFIQSSVEVLVVFFAGGTFAAGTTLLIGVSPAHMQPVVVVAAQETNGELAHLMVPLFDVVRNVTRVTNLGWPPEKKRFEEGLVQKLFLCYFPCCLCL